MIKKFKENLKNIKYIKMLILFLFLFAPFSIKNTLYNIGISMIYNIIYTFIFFNIFLYKSVLFITSLSI
jgi:hypothetical protein